MKVLLTGATGFIGAQVLEQLTERGDAVRVLVRQETLKRADRVRHLKRREGVEIIAGDLSDKDAVLRATKGVRTIYHLAAMIPKPGVRETEVVNANVGGTESLLRAAVENKVRRFVFASTVSLYGHTLSPAKEATPLDPKGVYGRTKFEAEKLVRSYHNPPSLETVILRFSHVYGPQAPFFEKLMERILQQPLAFLLQGGERAMQWIHVEDAAEGVVLAGTHRGAGGHEFNIAGDQIVTRRELVSLVYAAAGRSGRATQFSAGNRERGGLPLKYDISKARKMLGFNPQVPLTDGLAGMLAE